MIDYFVIDYNPDHHPEGNKMLLEVLEKLYQNRDPELTGETYLIDQGSNAEHREWLRGLQDSWDFRFNLLSLDRNVGISRAVNFGARLCRAPIMCVVTSDALFTRGADHDAVHKLKHPRISQVSPLSNGSDAPHQIAQVPEEFGADEVTLPGDVNYVHPCLACELTIRFYDMKLFDLIGYMDERWKACFECRDFSLRALIKGQWTVVSHGSYAWHYGHGSHITGAIAKAYEGYIDSAVHGGASPELIRMWHEKWPNLNLDFINGDFSDPTRLFHLEQFYPKNIVLPFKQDVPY